VVQRSDQPDQPDPVAFAGVGAVEQMSIGAAAALRPRNLPSYLRLGEPIGVGGTAVLWRARDRQAGRDVAVKVMATGSGDDAGRAVTRFTDEVRALARLSEHPHVLPFLAAGTDESTCWLVLALAEGSLAEVLWPDDAPGTALDPDDLIQLAESLADALAAAHEMEVVHGDVTPANVLRLHSRWVLADFGIASVQVGIGQASVVGATPGWAAPERIDGPNLVATRSSDVYGWAATVWSAATGERPNVVGPLDLTAVPRGLASIVADCLHPDPDRRPTMRAVAERVAAERRRRDRYIPDP